MVLGLKGQRSKLGLGLRLTAIRRGFEFYECLLVVTAVAGLTSECAVSHRLHLAVSNVAIYLLMVSVRITMMLSNGPLLLLTKRLKVF